MELWFQQDPSPFVVTSLGVSNEYIIEFSDTYFNLLINVYTVNSLMNFKALDFDSSSFQRCPHISPFLLLHSVIAFMTYKIVF